MRATRIDRDLSLGAWEMTVEAVDEPDGGTFYRPEPPTWQSGSGVPDPGLGDEGDYYMDTDAEPPEWYGPKGVEDESGDGDWGAATPLPEAEDGDWLSGGGDPDDIDDGDDGDYWLDTDTMAWWGPKADGSWSDTGPNYVRASWIEFDDPRPRTSGLYALPINALRVGDLAEVDAQSADAWLELCDEDGKRLLLIHSASLVSLGDTASRTDAAVTIAHLTGNAEVFLARWKIVGGKGLQWSGSGTMRQYA